MRERLHQSNAAYRGAIANATTLKTQRPANQVEVNLTPERLKQLEEFSGASSYRDYEPDLGADLLGRMDEPRVPITLAAAIRIAVEHNIDAQQVRLGPAIRETQITQAEAAFDAEFFADLSFQKLDTPRPRTPGATSPFGSTVASNTQYQTGIRKALQTGGQVSISTTIERTDEVPSFFADPTFYSTNIAVTVAQPLLRGFGTDVNRAAIELSRSGKRQGEEDVRQVLLDLNEAIEQSYWNLVFSYYQLKVQERLASRTEADKKIISERMGHDATEADLAEANSFAAQRSANVIRAMQSVREASDALKRLMNHPDLPLTGETLIEPADQPLDLAVEYNVLESITQALHGRPDVRQALMAIEDASIRQRVADNQRLPMLDVSATIRYNGVGEKAHWSYDNTIQGEFIDYIISAQFTAPLGNRERNAIYYQRLLERQAAVVGYQRTVQDAVQEVKNALRDVSVQYQLIEYERAGRIAAAENLRSLDVQQEFGAQLTPAFIDLKFRRQDALASAELREFQALVSYNLAIARYYRTVGKLLERNGVIYHGSPSIKTGWNPTIPFWNAD